MAKRKKISRETERAIVLDAAAAFFTITGLAKKHGVSSPSVYSILSRHHVHTSRPRPGSAMGDPLPFRQEPFGMK